MLVCPKCNHQNRPTAKFCSGCRTPLVAGVGYSGPAGPSAPAGPPAGNMNPTIPEGAWTPGAGQAPANPGPAGLGARVGGAAAETTLEQGGGGGGGPPWAGGGQPWAPNMAPGGTVYSEEVARDVAGWLVAIRSRTVPRYTDIPIHNGQNKLGRAQLLDPEASSDQMILAAQITAEGANVTIIDQGSRNGTFINQKRVQTQLLQKDDMIRVGKTTFVFIPRPALKQPVAPY